MKQSTFIKGGFCVKKFIQKLCVAILSFGVVGNLLTVSAQDTIETVDTAGL